MAKRQYIRRWTGKWALGCLLAVSGLWTVSGLLAGCSEESVETSEELRLVLKLPPELTVDTSRWIPGGDSTYYYAVPVAPGERTAPLCSHVIRLAESKDRADNTIYQVLDVFAEAIQAAPEEAVTQSWQVTLTDGVITAAP